MTFRKRGDTPPKSDPPKSEPPKSEPPKSEPPKSDPPKSEPPKSKSDPPKEEKRENTPIVRNSQDNEEPPLKKPHLLHFINLPPNFWTVNLDDDEPEPEPEPEPESSFEYDPDNYEEEIRREIRSIDDLIEIGKMYKERKRKRYNIDMRTLNRLVEPLTNLKKMIGMQKVKESIVDLIVYYMQGFERKTSNMLHTVLEGSPGCGKTTVAQIIADIYLKLGVISSDKFIVARRSDLVGKYLGHTAAKTQKVIDEASGGVLFIDEAYSLGNPEGRDSFSKECIDTINQNLTEGKCKFICIIAGYKDDLKSSFFSYNKGLERRFPFRYTIDDYTPAELELIYRKIAADAGWRFAEGCPDPSFFEKNKNLFKFNGGDMETLFQMTKIGHARRVFCLSTAEKSAVSQEDLERGLALFMNNDEVRKRNESSNTGPPPGMYC